ncbi:MAG: hypothetical protein KIT31_11775 [Deltaproteobacteria bacterium]|nr:hypothetical protein [Deltaproteobacteria bacterium]
MNTAEPALVGFYRAIIDLVRAPSLALLDSALALLGEITGADRVHVELSVSGPRLRRAWARSALPDELRNERSKTFCVPIAVGLPVGFTRLERFADHDAEAFGENECGHATALAWQLELVAERFDHDFVRRRVKHEVRLVQRRRVLGAVESSSGNITAAAREAGVSRAFVNQVIRRR